METQIIDFAQWYSGMERSKVESAYKRFLKERKEELSRSFCIHKGCKNKSTCGDYCGTHCNCRKK